MVYSYIWTEQSSCVKTPQRKACVFKFRAMLVVFCRAILSKTSWMLDPHYVLISQGHIASLGIQPKTSNVLIISLTLYL